MGSKSILIFFLVLIIVLGINSMVSANANLFKDYNVVVVRKFNVPPNIAAPETAGSEIVDKIIYQVRRYSQKYKLFDIIVKEGSQIPSGKKVLLIKGDVQEYTKTTGGKRALRSYVTGGHTGTASFAAHYQFVDKQSSKVLYETDLRSTSTGENDTVEYAMERNGEAAAKVITKYKGK